MITERNKGFLFAISAYVSWGFIPLYFKALAQISASELLVHRVLWSALFVGCVLFAFKRLPRITQHFRSPKTLFILACSAFFIAVNWVVFIWASNNNHLLDTSLGYYINPLVNVLFGLLFLGEKLRKFQWLAVVIAFSGVALQVITLGKLPLIALTLAFAFGFYGLMRKIVNVGAMEGLFIETLLLMPFVLIYLIFFTEVESFSLARADWNFALLLLAAGPVTSIPLMLFAAGVSRLNYSTIGFIQYLAPTIVLFTAVLWFNEPLVWQKAVTFVCIWTALAIYSIDAYRLSRKYSTTTAPS